MPGVTRIMDAAWLRRERYGFDTQQPSVLPTRITQSWPLSQPPLMQQRDYGGQQVKPQQCDSGGQQVAPQQCDSGEQQTPSQHVGVSTGQQPHSAGLHTVPGVQVSGKNPAGQVIGSDVQVTVHAASVGCAMAALPFPPAKTGSVPPAFVHACEQALAVAMFWNSRTSAPFLHTQQVVAGEQTQAQLSGSKAWPDVQEGWQESSRAQ